MPGTPSDLEKSAHETNSNDASAAAKKILPSCRNIFSHGIC